MKSVMKLARRSPVTISGRATVAAGIRLMEQMGVGVLLVLEGDRLVGTFTERDVMQRLVLGRRDADTTWIREVMTAPVFTISPEQSVEDALLLMHEHGVRHLPVVADGRIEGIVSQRYLLRAKVESLDEDLGSLTAYLSADGFGG